MNKRFAYKALDARGKPMNGFMDAASADEVGTWLADRNFFVLEITVSSLQGLVSSQQKKLTIKSRDMNFFLLQLSSLINAGCPLLMSLQALYRQSFEGSLKTLLKDICGKIESGKSFSEALKTHRDVFSNLFITMVEVGEVGGILGDILERYAHIYDAMYKIRGKIIKALIYPAILLIVTGVVTWALLVFVFPTIVERIVSRGQDLPIPTKLMMGMSSFLTAHWIGILVACVLFLAAVVALRKTEKGSMIFARLAVTSPIFGDLVRHFELALFSRILGTLLKCGVPILTSLIAIERTLGNKIFKKAIGDIRESVSRGESLSKSVARFRNLFPESIILMTDVGERAGNTGEMLEKAGAIYEDELENTIETAVSLIPHFLVIFLSFFIITLVLAVYLPLFDIINTVR